jgi:hypothetical protein
MKLDKAALASIAALPDDELWATISGIGREKGLKITATKPGHEELEKIRRALTGELSFLEAMRLVNKYKQGS